MTLQYEVLLAKEWMPVDKAQEKPSGWLHYEIHDEDDPKDIVTGVAPPGKWRKVVK